MTATSDGKNMAEQLRQEGVQLGWETRLVPFGKDITATVFPLGFASRVAMSFGGVQPGDFTRNLLYNKMRTYAFVLALGEVDDEKYAQAAGAINYGFPTIADTDIPEILPSGVCTYEHVVAMPKHFHINLIHEEIVNKAIEVRGLKIEVHHIPIPVAYGAAFEGERIRKEDMFVEFGGQRTPSFEFLRMVKNSADVTDGKIELFGPEIDDIEGGSQLPLGIVIEVYGREMQADFESVLERMTHTYVNGASGVWHNGQRDINWLRISKVAKEQGFKIKHLGDIIHARLHQEYGTILDKVQVKIYTNEDDVLRIREEARKSYHERDIRIAGMTDESVDTFYSCILCQSFAPKHVCVITPERSGLCGGYTWLDAKANFQIIPTGPNQPIQKNDALDEKYGQWQGVNEYLFNASRSALSSFSAYSMIVDPMTSCGCFECISAILPLTNGIMIVNREFPGMTPSGMKFSTLAGSVGGGLQTPGFIGHSKMYITSRKFISGDGGFKRIVWMTTKTKNDIGAILEARAKEDGIEGFLDMMADETIATTEEEVLEYISKTGHPVLEMDPMF
jgi:acetyl-CoA synthase